MKSTTAFFWRVDGPFTGHSDTIRIANARYNRVNSSRRTAYLGAGMVNDADLVTRFSWTTRSRSLRRLAVTGGGAVLLSALLQTSAFADCTFALVNPPGPLGRALAASINAVSSSITTSSTAFQTQTNAFIASPPGSQPNEFAGGLWARGVGGTTIVDATTTVRHAAPATTTTCANASGSDYTGVQGGFDFGTLSFGNSGVNIHGGLTFGYLDVNSTAGPSPTRIGTEAPFVGLYGALTYQNFYIDFQLRRDFYTLNFSDAELGVSGTKFNARGWGISSNAGYNYNFGNFFVEPSVGVNYSLTSVDTLALTPTLGPTTTLQLIKMNDVESVLGRAGVRVGTNFNAAGMALQPFLAASVWNEFASNMTGNRVNLAAGSTDFFNTNRIGTFGQYSFGVAGSLPSTGWLGYVRGDYRNGENIKGWSVNGGLRYQFAPAAAKG